MPSGTIGYFQLINASRPYPGPDNLGLLGYKADRSDTHVYINGDPGLSRVWFVTEEPQPGWAPNQFKCTLFAWDTSRGPVPPGGDWHNYDPWPLCVVDGEPKLTFADDQVPEAAAYWVSEHYTGDTPNQNFIRLTPLTAQGGYLSPARERNGVDNETVRLVLNVTESDSISNRWLLRPLPAPPGGIKSAPRLATA